MDEDGQVLSPACLNSWDKFLRSLNHSMTDLAFLSDPNKSHLKESSMAVIRERNPQSDHDDCSVFPPINHENLHISSLFEQDESGSPDSPSLSSSSSSASLSSPSSSFSPSGYESPLYIELSDTEAQLSVKLSDAEALTSHKPSNSREVSGWSIIYLKILGSKLSFVVSSFQNYAAKRAVLPSILTAVATIATFWWLKRWVSRWRRRKVESLVRLNNVIKEKDEKIVGLMLQIAQMNEALLNHHRIATAKLVDSLKRKA